MEKFQREYEGQIAFFKDLRIDVDVKLINNTDGIYNGNLFEFKLAQDRKNTISKCLKQSIKYLSRMRVKGEPVPKNILIIYLNQEKCYVFNANDYFEEIHEIYWGSASKDNEGFDIKSEPEEIDYSTDSGIIRIQSLLKQNNFVKIRIDEDCVVGWATKFYNEVSGAKKADFIGDEEGKIKIVGEIREPNVFKNFILPYKGKTNERFKYLMDCLNDPFRKKELGAFFTPPAYCKKAVELVRAAIKRVPVGNDYIILDRCAGTGNLQVDGGLTSEELEHVVVSTYEYFEYKVLMERLNGQVRFIIPPSEKHVTYGNGSVLNADALSKEYIEHPAIKKYINDKHCTVILFENPPYSESGARETVNVSGGKQVYWKNSYVCREFKKKIKGKASNDLGNLFIWSGFEYYLRQPTDSYILFSPIKYWKAQKIINRKFYDGFLFNRRFFHLNEDKGVSCIYWGQGESKPFNELKLKAFNLDKKTMALDNINKTIPIVRVHHTISELYDLRKNAGDHSGVASGSNGYENKTGKMKLKPVYNKEIIGYLLSQSFGFENPRLGCNLTRCAMFNGHGFYLTGTNYYEKLPLFAVGKYPIEKIWYENGILMKCSDNGNNFVKDASFLKACLVFACLSYYNKCISFTGSDKRFYRNELCFDKGTLASTKLLTLKSKLTMDDKRIIDLWNKVLLYAKKCDGKSKTRKSGSAERPIGKYNKTLKYGVYQISKELNTGWKEMETPKHPTIVDYPNLDNALERLNEELEKYYLSNIKDKLFKFGLLK